MVNSSTTSGDSSLPPTTTTRNTSSSILPKTSPITFSHSLSIRLDENNFLPWKHQVYHAIKGGRLLKHLDANLTPQKYLSVADREENRVSPEFEDWDQQDSLLVSWLLSSMSEKILTRMVG